MYKKITSIKFDWKIKIKVIRKHNPVPLLKRPKVRGEMQHLIEMGIVENSTSEYWNPLRIIEKDGGNIRICLNAWWLNKIILQEHDGPLEIDDILQKYLRTSFFSTTDLTQGYIQIPLEKKSRKYNTFVFEGKAFQFTQIPFGIKTSSNGFIRRIISVFGDAFSDFFTMYVDDILIPSKTFDEHLSWFIQMKSSRKLKTRI